MWSIVAALAVPVCAAAAAAPNGPTPPPHSPTQTGPITDPISDPSATASYAFAAAVAIAAIVAALIIWKAKLLRGLGGRAGETEPVIPPPRDPQAVHPLGWFWAVFLMFFAMAIGSVVGGLLGGPDPTTPRAQATSLGVSGLIGIAACVGVWLLAKRFAPKAGLVITPRDLLTGSTAFALAYPIVFATGTAASLIADLLGHVPPSPIAHETLQLIVDTMNDPWTAVLLVAVILVVPVVEEVLYRGLLQTATLRVVRRPWPAAIITAALFAAMHWPIIPDGGKHAIVQLFVLGLALGLAFERTGRLGTPIVMHVLFNATNVLLAVASAGPAAP